MSRTHAGVEQADLFGLDSALLRANLRKLRGDLRLLLGFIHVIAPAPAKRRVVVPLQPEAAEAVFHHVADDPFGREKLGRRADALLGDLDVLFQQLKGFILEFGVVILVQPSDHLNIRPIFRVHRRQHRQHGILPQQPVGEEQFRVIADGLEHLRQHVRKLIAQRDQQFGIERFGSVALQQLDDVGKIHAVQLDVLRLPNQLRQRAGRVRQHAHGDGQQVMLLHIAQRDEAVEPCVGGFLHHLLIAAALDARQQRVALVDFRLREQRPAERLNHFGGDDRAARAGLFVNAEPPRAILHALDERHARGDGEIFELGLVHGYILLGVDFNHPCLPPRGRCRRRRRKAFVNSSESRRSPQAPARASVSAAPHRPRSPPRCSAASAAARRSGEWS